MNPCHHVITNETHNLVVLCCIVPDCMYAEMMSSKKEKKKEKRKYRKAVAKVPSNCVVQPYFLGPTEQLNKR